MAVFESGVCNVDVLKGDFLQKTISFLTQILFTGEHRNLRKNFEILQSSFWKNAFLLMKF